MKWRVMDVVKYGTEMLIDGLPQFGFHDHTGALYIVQHDRNFVGLIEAETLSWTAGEENPGLAPVHYEVTLNGPKFISRSFHQERLLISEARSVYVMDLATKGFVPIIDKIEVGIVDLGNCVYDFDDGIWVNDIRGCRIFHFDPTGTLIETLGSKEAGFQLDTVPFEEVRFNWIYDLRLGPDGNLYVLDSRNYAVRKIDLQSKLVSTICGDGQGDYKGDGGDAKCARLGTNPQDKFDGPWSLFVDEDNNIIIGDTHNRALRMIEAGTNVITTIATATDRTSSGEYASFERICGMDYWDGTLYIPDWRAEDPNTLVVLQRVD